MSQILTSWGAGRVTIRSHWELERVLSPPTFAKSLAPVAHTVASRTGMGACLAQLSLQITFTTDGKFHVVRA